MKTRNLSKSQYCRGKKCKKSLWLYRNKKELADTPTEFMQNIFDQGTAVGELATDVFEEGVLVGEDYTETEQALSKTEILVAQNVPAIFEAAFIFESVLIRVDVLRNNNDGTWDLIEVKSTNSVEPKSHLDDAAIQKWVLLNCGIIINKTILMHLNREYVREGDLNLKDLFVLEDISEAIQPNYVLIENELENIKTHISLPKEPEELIGAKCKNPYLCDFKSYCWAEAQPGTIHTLGRISDKKRHELMDMSVALIEDIPDNYKLSTNQQIETLSYKNNDTQIDLKNINNHLTELKYPLYYLDYESVAYAVPKFDGSWPHKHLVTQYSLHIQETPSSELIHKEYLHNKNTDPSLAITERLLQDIKDDGGSIIVYHKTYERDRTGELAAMLPKFQDQLHGLIDRMWDLETPFTKRWYWDKEFNGSSSIKNVLPVFAPEFSYNDLEIKKGDTAQMKYGEMAELPEESQERLQIYNALLKYCERDTLAMVIILQKLFETLNYDQDKVAV
ncbi:MAG: DUF2779 domain-containing protein [Halobacteriovoraceae bacterium]|jgi:hypothetical protein|nr:DUF2779 domain-containing protein [Halobacteriovoraceae bacterium]